MKHGTGPDQAATQSQRSVQGEGDYEAAHRYRDEVQDFLANSDIEQLAHDAAPDSARQERELALAEDAGKSRSKGEAAADAGIMYPHRKLDASQ